MEITYEGNDSFSVNPPETVITVPAGWINDAPGHYTHVRPPCVYRLVSKRFDENTLVASPVCALDQTQATVAKCQACPYVGTPLETPQAFTLENHNGVMVTVYHNPVLPSQVPRPVPPVKSHVNVLPPPTPVAVPTPTVASEPRPDLAAIALTLPAPNPEKDAERTFRRPIFHDDGSIEYPREEGSWEPPRDINGYARDPNNNFLFHPLWLPCALRHQSAIMRPGCGCIEVIMRCNSPQATKFGQRLAHTDCEACPVRRK